MYKHFLITRFNLRTESASGSSNQRYSSDSWLENRFQLFDEICWPSVFNQANQNFRWLVFFDIDTPELYLDQIKSFEIKFENFEPIFIDGAGIFNREVIKEVFNRLSPEDEFLITSRLDNDDAIHQDYIQTIQDHFKKQDYCYIDILKGYSLLYSHKIKLAKINKPYNPFSSLIEKKSDHITTISTREHSHWETVQDKISIPNKRLWLQVVHDRNVSNQFGHKGYLVSGGFLSNDYEVLKKFNVNTGNKINLSGFGVFRSNLTLLFTFFFRFLSKRLKYILKRI